MSDIRRMIAKNVASLLHDGDFVNLGVGMPTLVSTFLKPGCDIVLHGENGSTGLGGELPFAGMYDSPEVLHDWMVARMGDWSGGLDGHKDLVNAGGNHTKLLPGAACFDSCVSFAMARGGRLDATVLGAMEVDSHANLANWMIPGKRESGMGGAMDIVCGCKKVIIAMEHCNRKGMPKIVNECSLPLTAKNCVSHVVTELCMIDFVDGEMIVTAIAPGITPEEVQAKTEPKLTFAPDMRLMELDE